jgi:glycerophosphoryl diester phosphodiesterase
MAQDERAANPLRLAHRGDWRRAPENTLPALLAALDIPACDGLEFDIRLSRDGVPVLLHDETLERVQGRPDRVDAPAAEALERHGIPRLDVVLAAVPAQAFLDIELKGEGHGDATAAVLRAGRSDRPSRAVVSSFEAPALRAMRERLPGWDCWLNTEDLEPGTVALARDLGCAAISVEWRAITPARLARAHDAGLGIATWTVRRRSTWRRLAGLGVIGMCVEAAALDG